LISKIDEHERQWIGFAAVLFCVLFSFFKAFAFDNVVVTSTDPSLSSTQYKTRVVINIPTRNMILYRDGLEFKRFQVGVGRPEFPSPIGHFSIICMTMNPAWENPYLGAGKMRIAAGARNPWGTRWMAFKEDDKGQWGMHGTDSPKSVGQYSSHGCIRMFIPNAEELYKWVELGTPVDVTYEPVIIQVVNNTIIAAAYPDRYHRGMPSVSELVTQIQSQYPDAVVETNALGLVIKQPTGRPVVVGKLLPHPVYSENSVRLQFGQSR
jgi:hypothetical protein